MPLKSLANAIRFMAAGERYVPLELLNDRNTARDSLEHPLTDREFGVLEHLAEGRSNRDIATALNLAEQNGFPSWVSVDKNKVEGVLKALPERSDIAADINESLIVELYSR